MRIACILPESIGDFILTTPSLQSLQRHFIHEEIAWHLPESLTELSNLFPLAAKRVPLSRSSPTPDLTLCFPPATRYYLLARRIGGSRRIGYVHEKMLVPRVLSRICLTDRWVCPSDSPLHELEAYGKILSLIDVTFEPTFPTPQASAEDVLEARRWLPAHSNKKVIAFHFGMRWTENPAPMLQNLARSHPDFHVLALLGNPESPNARQRLSEENLPNLAIPGPGSLSGMIALLKQSDLFVGVDGGLVHLAAAAGTPALVFYPNDRYDSRVAKWHPWNIPYQALPLSRENIERIPELIENLFCS